MERARYIPDELQARSKETVQRKKMKVEDEVNRLSLWFAWLTLEEWIDEMVDVDDPENA